MPRYDFQCQRCGALEERLTSWAAIESQTCAKELTDVGVGAGTEGVQVTVCGGPMRKLDSLPLTARTPYAWRP